MTRDKPPANNKEAAEQSFSRTQRGQLAAAVEVPERPVLAPHVQLIGEMQGTGFKDRQWLIRRDGQFLQITELLYRVAEQANGERTLEEIAAGVTESTDWMVSADNVQQLIQIKLIPMGLIVSADGSLVSRGENRVRSPLTLNARKTVFGPRVINPITGLLQVLYAPPVLIPVLIVIALAHWWLYLVHGVTRSFLEALYTPGLLLVVLAVMLVGGAFHEFGHASALRYGGGRVRGMGVGLYLIYPAVYTDVTDSYRLGRWARVRTDLGGFYFHLIFALGIIALYLIFGQEFLLFVVVLINLDIVYQCMPFVRFDGYWALADLTGVPDFFSQMGAFLRSVLPVRRWEGDKLPNLKPWVKAVFVAYVVVTVPVLLLLLFLLVTRLPGIAMTAWDSLLLQARRFSIAMNNGDLLGMTTSAVQAFILGLQVLGISYLLYALGRRLLGALWRQSTPKLARRHVPTREEP